MTGRAQAGAARLARRAPLPVLRGVARAVRMARRGPGVSVVLVVTDDNTFFLDECIDSLGRQERRADEIILVVTGMTPFAHGVAQRQARASHRVRLVRAPGAGIAEATERGVAAATGDHVLHHDVGDLLTPRALAALSAALDRSGCDLAVGGQPRAAAQVDLSSAPEALGVLAPGTRMVRRAAWRPEVYDVPPAMSHWLPGVRSVLGGSPPPTFATVTDPVHQGLVRGTGLAFGAMPRLAGVAGAFAAEVRGILAALDGLDAAGAGRVFVRWLLAEELPRHLDDAERCDGDQWAALVSLADDLLARASGWLTEVPVEPRAAAWLASQGRSEQLAELTVSRWRRDGGYPTEVVDGRLLAVLGVDLPDEVREVATEESALRPVVRRALRTADGRLDLELLAIAGRLGGGCGPATVSARVEDAAGDPVEVEATLVDDPEANAVAGERFHDHTGRALRISSPTAPHGPFDLTVELVVAGIPRSATVTGLEAGPAAADGTRIDAVDLRGAELQVRGSGPPPAEIVVHHAGGVLRAPTAADGEAFVARVVLEHDPWARGSTPLPPGRLRIDHPMGEKPAAAAPMVRRTNSYRMRVHRGGDGTVVLDLGPPLADDEVGAHGQHLLQQRYAADPRPVDPTLVLFQSYTGQATDSPLAIHTAMRRLRPELRSLWAVSDRSVVVPEGARPVLLRSREWYDALATARHVVTNIDLEPWFAKRPGQRVLQTYHGHPSKAMGRMAWEAKGFTPRRVAEMLRRTSGTWDLLVAPSPAAEELYRGQFDYTGPVVSAGYPRNDDLVAPDRDERRATARARLGIADHQRVVLHAPTWRDDLATNHRVAPMAAMLDVDAAASALGEDHVILQRGHRFHRHRAAPPGARVVDVTDHPQVNDLILAADVAVLDYSSLRFDIALAGRPMVFLVPDLERYAGSVRGFLHDFAATAPGPLVDTTAEVVDHLRHPDRLVAEHGPALEAFVTRFWAEQDAHSADRVVAAFWPDPGPVGTGR